MIATVKQGLKEDGIQVPMTKLCRWFEVPRRTVYYRPTNSAVLLDTLAKIASPLLRSTRDTIACL